MMYKIILEYNNVYKIHPKISTTIQCRAKMQRTVKPRIEVLSEVLRYVAYRSPRLLLVQSTLTPGLYPGPGV